MSNLGYAKAKIADLLAEIQATFKPGAKVLLVVDNGDPEEGLMMGDANTCDAIDLIRYLDALPDKTTTPDRGDGTRADGDGWSVDRVFDALRAAYARGVEWARENSDDEYRAKAAYDYADKMTAPVETNGTGVGR